MPIYMNGDSCNVFSKLIVEDGVSGGGNVTPESTPISTIEVVNKTGEVVNEGDKVWLNENAQTAGSSYKIEDTNVSNPSSNGVLSRTGNFAWRNEKLFTIGADSATLVSSFSADAECVKYGSDGSVFIIYDSTSYRVDETAQYAVKYHHIKDDYFMSSSQEIVQLNVSDGSLITSLGGIGTSYNNIFKINNVFYSVSTSAYKFVHNGSSFDTTQINITNGASDLNVIDITADNKYVIGSTSAYYSNRTTVGKLRMLDVIDEDNIKILTQAEMPVDLQEFYDTACCIVFNPYTGILTVTGYENTSYAIMKYENGVWTKLPIDIGTLENNAEFKGSLTVSDDLTRACYSTAYVSGTYGYRYSYIVNLTTNQGYTAVPYRFYNMNENTITGKAMTSAELDGTFTVATVL